ncbi:hypothetical protein L3Q82_014510 [Scortum barcoo]|uniref:Uncharacterized protein n=1 Tax=Scortum barcoo TaxID=214431 RepID=A0ACB8VWW1_9TELE|nr:hypothetical protein L3Q82_014510 [Scortum barcoo]
MSHREEEASGKTQDTLEKLCLSAGLGTPRGPPGRAGGSVWGLGYSGTGAGFGEPAGLGGPDMGWSRGTGTWGMAGGLGAGLGV